MAGKWVIRQMDAKSGTKLYYARLKAKWSDGTRWVLVKTPVTARKFFRQEQAENVAFQIVLESPQIVGMVSVVEWDGNWKAKP